MTPFTDHCLLLVVEDSPAALTAARYTTELARLTGAPIRAVSVVSDGVLADAMAEVSGRPDVRGRRDLAVRSMLRHVERLAGPAEVPLETVLLSGDTAEQVLDEARRVRPEMIVLGRDEIPQPGGPVLVPWAARILEFAEQPVLVVPAGWRAGGERP
ncbi:universal stress protein [Actinomadura formosensis]|uniref:universal stress protein n=1 Tax=Actinomadura formosensis TaxID=60706 RepID=UPI00082DC05B|nr:universal stress protein [Actinomadura formosensis]